MAKLFTQSLAELRGGLVERELTAELQALVERVQETGQKGKLTLSLTLTPKGRMNREVHVTSKIATVAPPAVDLSEPTIFYAVRGDLVRDDPDQRDMFGVRSPGVVVVDQDGVVISDSIERQQGGTGNA